MHKKDSSWEVSSKWYDTLVGEKGHLYHKEVIFPKLLPMLDLKENSSLIDLACGQGILSRVIPKATKYLGIDLAPDLIKQAQKRSPQHLFVVGDVCKPIKAKGFSHAVCLLALQNLEFPAKMFLQASQALKPGGSFVIVMNHPSFRIPRQSSWGIDEKQKMQYRRIQRYLSPLRIPISMQPSKGQNSATTWSFHYPLSAYSKWLREAGFCIDLIDEWSSTKKSTGKYAKMENIARAEFPLFLAIKATKLMK